MHHYNRAYKEHPNLPTHPAVPHGIICFPCLHSTSCKARLTKGSPVEFQSTVSSNYNRIKEKKKGIKTCNKKTSIAIKH